MELLVLILKDYRKVEGILLGFIELDVRGATVIEAQGMGQLLGDVPIMADLKGLFPGSAHDSYMIVSAVHSSKINECLQLVTETCGSLEEPGSGIAFTLPIGHILGLSPGIQ